MARLWALVMASMSPVSPRLKSVSGMHWARPPPAAEPLMLKVGPPEGCRMAAMTFLPSRPMPSDEAHGGGGLALAQGGGGDGRDLDVFPVGLVLAGAPGCSCSPPWPHNARTAGAPSSPAPSPRRAGRPSSCSLRPLRRSASRPSWSDRVSPWSYRFPSRVPGCVRSVFWRSPAGRACARREAPAARTRSPRHRRVLAAGRPQRAPFPRGARAKSSP